MLDQELLEARVDERRQFGDEGVRAARRGLRHLDRAFLRRAFVALAFGRPGDRFLEPTFYARAAAVDRGDVAVAHLLLEDRVRDRQRVAGPGKQRADDQVVDDEDDRERDPRPAWRQRGLGRRLGIRRFRFGVGHTVTHTTFRGVPALTGQSTY